MTEDQVQRQADSEVTAKPLGTRIRFVHVKRWIKVARGWRAVIDWDHVVEMRKRKNVAV